MSGVEAGVSSVGGKRGLVYLCLRSQTSECQMYRGQETYCAIECHIKCNIPDVSRHCWSQEHSESCGRRVIRVLLPHDMNIDQGKAMLGLSDGTS